MRRRGAREPHRSLPESTTCATPSAMVEGRTGACGATARRANRAGREGEQRRRSLCRLTEASRASGSAGGSRSTAAFTGARRRGSFRFDAGGLPRDELRVGVYEDEQRGAPGHEEMAWGGLGLHGRRGSGHGCAGRVSEERGELGKGGNEARGSKGSWGLALIASLTCLVAVSR